MTGKNTMENSKKANGMQKYRLYISLEFDWFKKEVDIFKSRHIQSVISFSDPKHKIVRGRT
jgi:hypothetical protein